MSHENVEIVRLAIEAAIRRPKPDFAAMNALYHPDHEWISLLERLDGGTRRGAEGYDSWRQDAVQAAAGFETRIEQITVIDEDRLLVVMPTRFRFDLSGVELDEQRLACLVTVHGGKVVRTVAYNSVPEALEAAGVAE
jgi:ketosteroid isomerase-like protein